MVLLKYFLFSTLLVALVQADRNQTDFISIDCGSSNSSYVDKTTGFVYLSDTNFIETGENSKIEEAYRVQFLNEQQLWNVRSFPQGTRNCYTLRPTQGKGNKYLIRASFMYGNYDIKRQAPTFDLYLGVDLWDTVITTVARNRVDKEIIYVPSTSDNIHVCLVNTGYGIPFISVLELRPINNNIYVSESGSLLLLGRYDLNPTVNQVMRYEDDVYDRLWSPLINNALTPRNTTNGNIRKNSFELPSPVMSTAYEPNCNTGNHRLVFTPDNSSTTLEYYFYMHFAELQVVQKNQSREFNIFFNGNLSHASVVPSYMVTTTLLSRSSASASDGKVLIWLNQTQNSTLPPLLNAVEVYLLKELSQLETNQTDVDAILNIKTVYGLKKSNWQGDPCAPEAYLWSGLNCSYSANNPPRIVSLNLSSSGLRGLITPHIGDLTMLQCLDLSNNRLNGTVPDLLAEIPFLRVLNLKGNNLEGPIPPSLLKRSKNGLSLSVDANMIGNQTASSPTNVTPSSSPRNICETHKFVVPLVALVSGFLLHFVTQ